MEQTTNTHPPQNLLPDPGLAPDPRIAPIAVPRVSTLLTDDAAAAVSPIRVDGWTPAHIRAFLAVLSRTGSVAEAARNVRLSRQSAYALRNSARGRAFAIAWNAAHILAHRRLADDLLERATHGQVDLHVSDGRIVGERHRFDSRLALALLGRLDSRLGQIGPGGENAQLAAAEFEDFIDLAAAGGDGAADFLAERRCDREHWRAGREARLLEAAAESAAPRARARRHCQPPSTSSANRRPG